MEIFVMYT